MSKIGILVSPERSVTTSGDGSVTERFKTRNSDGSTSVFSVSHHKGCAGEWPCGCDPIKTSDCRRQAESLEHASSTRDVADEDS